MGRKAVKVETVKQADDNIKNWKKRLAEAKIVKDEERQRECKEIIADYEQQLNQLKTLSSAAGTPTPRQASRAGQASSRSLTLTEAASTTHAVTIKASVREERKESVKETTIERVKRPDGHVVETEKSIDKSVTVAAARTMEYEQSVQDYKARVLKENYMNFIEKNDVDEYGPAVSCRLNEQMLELVKSKKICSYLDSPLKDALVRFRSDLESVLPEYETFSTPPSGTIKSAWIYMHNRSCFFRKRGHVTLQKLYWEAKSHLKKLDDLIQCNTVDHLERFPELQNPDGKVIKTSHQNGVFTAVDTGVYRQSRGSDMQIRCLDPQKKEDLFAMQSMARFRPAMSGNEMYKCLGYFEPRQVANLVHQGSSPQVRNRVLSILEIIVRLESGELADYMSVYLSCQLELRLLLNGEKFGCDLHVPHLEMKLLNVRDFGSPDDLAYSPLQNCCTVIGEVGLRTNRPTHMVECNVAMYQEKNLNVKLPVQLMIKMLRDHTKDERGLRKLESLYTESAETHVDAFVSIATNPAKSYCVDVDGVSVPQKLLEEPEFAKLKALRSHQ
jgi:hypothetical protein